MTHYLTNQRKPNGMMKKILFAIVIFLGSFYWYSFTSESKKYELLNEIISDDQLLLSKICIKSEVIERLNDGLNDFILLEQLSLNFQKIMQTEHQFKAGKIQYYNRRLHKVDHSTIISKCDRQHEMLTKLSLPLVAPDRQSVIIKITEDCNCMLGGQSGTYLYQKSNGKWKRVKMLEGWIS